MEIGRKKDFSWEGEGGDGDGDRKRIRDLSISKADLPF